MKLGNLNLSAAFLGNTEIVRILHGPDVVYEKNIISKGTYFFIEDLSGAANTLSIKATSSSAPNITIQKSLDGKNWESMGTTGTTAITATIPAKGKLYLRSSKNYWGSSFGCNRISATGNHAVGGNIQSLLISSGINDAWKWDDLPEEEYIFSELFYQDRKLINASKLFLPAVARPRCYHSMFYGCTSLVAAPELPATTLMSECYRKMFYECSSLTAAPELPATTLSNYCYTAMFYGCTSLTAAPELPATTLSNNCYASMFVGCTSLTTAPKLPATTLRYECYCNMFTRCTSLTAAPELPATTLATYCYAYMFQGCSRLNYIKALFLTISSSTSTDDWVKGVAATGTFVKNADASWDVVGNNGVPTGWTVKSDVTLTTPFYIKDLSGEANTLSIVKNNSYAPTLTIEKSLDGETWETMGTTSTTAITATIPANGKVYIRCSTNAWGYVYINRISASGNHAVGGNIMSLLQGSDFPNGSNAMTSANDHAFYMLFHLDGKLIDASNLLLPATTLVNYCYADMFYKCTSLTMVPELPATTLANACYMEMFRDCTSLTTAPELSATTLATYCYHQMFYNCTSLTTAPELPATTLAENCYDAMFRSCTALTNAPELSATTLADNCYRVMFTSCTSLTTAPELPATTLADSCYAGMFRNCESLTSAPELPATTLVNSCYIGMFYNCRSLKYIKAMFLTTPSSSSTQNWVYGVAATGTFVKNGNATWNVTGDDGVPSGWTVQTASE